MIIVLLIGLVGGGLAYLNHSNPDALAALWGGGNSPAPSPQDRVNGGNDPTASTPTRPRTNDPVMGNLLPNGPDPPPSNLPEIDFDAAPTSGDNTAMPPGGMPPGGMPPGGMTPGGMTSEDNASASDIDNGSESPAMAPMNAINTADAMPAMDAANSAAMISGDGNAMTAGSDTMTSGSDTMAAGTDTMADESDDPEVDAAIESIRSAIRDPQWDTMKSMAERTRALNGSDRQKAVIETLYLITDLASYYRGGVRRGLQGQTVGDQLEIVRDVNVIVTEVTDDAMAIQYDRKSQRYTIDELPLPLADRLAEQPIEAGPTRDAAAAVYHIVAPTATDEVRKVELNYLRSISEPLEAIPPKRIADELALIFAGA